MRNIHANEYDAIRTYVIKARRKNKSWENILFKNSSKYNLENFIEIQVETGEFPEDITVEDFKQIVEEQKKEEEAAEELKVSDEHTVMIAERDEENEVFVPPHPNSSWQLYKEKLSSSGFTEDSIYKLEDSTLKILKKLNRSSLSSEIVKGLMVGHVQSGKTASMAALMAMAADWGWNYFVILSGTIENLRSQTETRLWEDLNHSGNLEWNIINKPSKGSNKNERLQSLHLSDRDKQRYFTVSLKNHDRLRKLNQWLEEDERKLKQINMIIIDDEADQASINTKNVDSEKRAKINKLIVDLVEGKNKNVQPRSTNYISYTATPYSNFLNESSTDSLYPKDFIGALPTAKEYFGPKEIFGLEEELSEGVNIIRRIQGEEVKKVKDLEKGKTSGLPLSMKRSLAWFVISVASLRHPSISYQKPVSMLVHTSHRQEHHDRMANEINNFLKKTSLNELMEFCKKVYEEETASFTIEDLKESVPYYPVKAEEMNTYPPFEEIKEEMKNIINTNVSHIMMGEDEELQYHEGMHLCIDNCSKNGLTEDDFHVRLAYPERGSKNYPEKAPAFIIIGGSTLSRGLTIEGLVSTYFLRGSNTSDTLMQMGRWFGFRKGYEIFPRVWMTTDTEEKFRSLSNLEAELREELEDFSKTGKRPEEYGPRVKNSPQVSWMRITAANRMQNARSVDLDFSGISRQMIHYHTDKEVLENNVKATELFLRQCPTPYQSVMKNSIVFEGIDFSLIKNYLTQGMTFHRRSAVFNQINDFCEWFEKFKDTLNYDKWNVVVSGVGNPAKSSENQEKTWPITGFNIGMVRRSARVSEEGYDNLGFKNIGVLRAPSDLMADIPKKHFDLFRNEEKKFTRLTNNEVSRLRKKYGLENTPQLLIYRIDGREGIFPINERSLNLPVNPVGVCIFIPGDLTKGTKAKALQIQIEPNEENIETEE